MPRLHIRVLLIACPLLLLSGCGPERLGLGGDPAPTATPTWVPVPTFTPTSSPPPTKEASESEGLSTTAAETAAPPQTVSTTDPQEADTLESSTHENNDQENSAQEIENSLLPTATLPAAAAAEPQTDKPQITVIVEAANIRSGPSTDYGLAGAVARGETYLLTGRNPQGDWWQICCFGEQSGWIFGTLVEVQNAESVATITDLPPLPPTPTPQPVAEAPPAEPDPAEPEPSASESTAPEPTVPGQSEPEPAGDHSGTAGNFDPNVQYQIVHYRVLGYDDNNGGIFNKGGQQHIFVTVLGQNGSGVDGAVLKDAVGDNLTVVTGDKGPGKTEIKMDWDPYKLYVAEDPAGEVSSQVSNQMNNPHPHIPDVVGLLGPPEVDHAICPTIDDRCSPPFYHAHWSYEITFQRVK